MIHSNSEFDLAHDLEKRLAPRRAIEAAMSSGELKHVHKDTLVMRERIARPILRGILKMAGIYSRGIRNALQPVVRNVRLEFEDLPASFDGFRILQLADLHIDGMDGLAEIVAERIAGLHADLCVMTGDYRFELVGPCPEVYPRLRTILSSVHADHGVRCRDGKSRRVRYGRRNRKTGRAHVDQRSRRDQESRNQPLGGRRG